MATSVVVQSPVLVLNQNYEPLNLCQVRRAIVLVGRGKAEQLVDGDSEIHTSTVAFPAPSVIRLIQMVKRPFFQRRLSRRDLFIRDDFTCQYCGKDERAMTIDHVMPRFRGGVHSWENVVTACIPCNHRKAGRTPREANMKLARVPRAPRPNPYYLFHRRSLRDEWRPFIPWVN